ncbi:MAG: alpha/beta hydrolase-fold protein [bacterium]|nr:alpha/beta hydrolase-fold protein [bacterium]
MKKLLILLSIFILATSCQKVDEIVGPEINEGATTIVSIPASDANIGTKQAMVYLPPGFDTTKNYPVVLFLHGYGGNYLFWQSVEDIKGILDYMISSGKIKPCIAVMPDAYNVLGGSFYTNSEYQPLANSVFGRYEDYIINDVVGFIKTNYPVDTSEIYLIGISMGGYGALKLGVKHPDTFKGCASHSGPIAFAQFLETIPGANVNMIQAVLSEWADFGFRIPCNPDTIKKYLGPSRPLTTMLIAMAGAFSPKVGPLFAFDTLNYELPLDTVPETFGTVWAGVRLPLTREGDTNSVFNEWLTNHDVFNLIESNFDNIRQHNLKIYIDCGYQDELFLAPHALACHTLLENLSYEHYFELFTETPGYPADDFPPRHGTHLQIRVYHSLKYFLGY